MIIVFLTCTASEAIALAGKINPILRKWGYKNISYIPWPGPILVANAKNMVVTQEATITVIGVDDGNFDHEKSQKRSIQKEISEKTKLTTVVG